MIKSIIDVVTNSSTEVFILQDSRNYDEVNENLKNLGYQGEVIKLTKELFQELKYSDPTIQELNYTLVDREIHNFAWFRLYRNHIFNPVEEIPRIDKDGFEYYIPVDYEKETPLQHKIKLEFLDQLVEKCQDDGLFYSYKKTKNIHVFPRQIFFNNPKIKEKFKSWIENNINEFPDYKKLLKMYDANDISDILGNWYDFFDDDLMPIKEYLGDVLGNKNFNYKLIRLS